jgi:hypothetical protein
MKQLLILTLVILTFYAKAETESTPLYLWNSNKISGNIGENFGISFANKTHFNLTEQQAVLHYTQIILKYPLQHHIYVAAGYRQQYYKNSESWLAENRAMSYLGYTNKKHNISLLFINRLSSEKLTLWDLR